ncbi:MAG: mediator complex subunit [Caeruleum heppii]|nr:MAG: mediator complex subunit [Caeruleum heppii]
MPGIRMENGLGQRAVFSHVKHEDGHQEPLASGLVGTNGDASAGLSNGQPVTAADISTAQTLAPSKEASVAALTTPQGSEGKLLPELEHVSQGYQSLPQLCARVAQETCNDLGNAITAMAEMSSAPGPPHLISNQVNGTVNVGVNGSSSASTSATKKARLMEVVQHRRAQFIKLLVMAQWSRQTKDVGKVIDIYNFLLERRVAHEHAENTLFQLKLDLNRAKVPNPDLKTALEVLSTGKASWLPDLGYIQPDPLTPQDMLKTLRNLDTLLHIRLNLQEEIPSTLKSFHIASGRATFDVPNEFEIDLSIADEDPSRQLYFIDFRFRFAPANESLPDGPLKDEIEGRANDALGKEGLRGCYDFLHSLCLTHKINILASQAVDLSREMWSGAIKVEMVRRTLVVQYWTNRSGKKSWFEIGIRGGEKLALDGRDPTHTDIGVRWMREGKEVTDVAISMDRGNLCLSDVLKHIIARHVTHLLRSVRKSLLAAPLYRRKRLALSLSTSSSEPGDSMLEVQLTPTKLIKLRVEPFAGQFVIESASSLASRAEHELNSLKASALDSQGVLANLRCLVAQEEMESRARCVGWDVLKTLNPRREDLKRICPSGTLRQLYFTRKGWRPDWVLTASIGMAGEQWWILELIPNAEGHRFGDCQPLHISSPTRRCIDPTYDFFSRLDRAAAGLITHFVNARELGRDGISHSLRTLRPSPRNPINTPSLLVRVSSLMGHTAPSRSKRPLKPWAKEVIKLTYHHGATHSGRATVITEARLVSAELVAMVPSRIDDNVIIHPKSGALAFRLHSAVGEPVISQVREHLRRISRLIDFLVVIHQYRIPCAKISLSNIICSYSNTPELRLSADIRFPINSPITLSLSHNSPHLRIQDFLARLLNADGGFRHVSLLLGTTLPLYLTLDELEGKHQDDNFLVLLRAADWLHIRYQQPRFVLEVQLRNRRNQAKWFLHEDESTARDPGRKPEMVEALKEVYDGSGDGWLGLRTGIATDSNGVAVVLRLLDSILSRFADTPTPITIAPGSGSRSGEITEKQDVVMLSG